MDERGNRGDKPTIEKKELQGSSEGRIDKEKIGEASSDLSRR